MLFAVLGHSFRAIWRLAVVQTARFNRFAFYTEISTF